MNDKDLVQWEERRDLGQEILGGIKDIRGRQKRIESRKFG